MRNYLLFGFAFLLMVFGCKKNYPDNKPVLHFEKVNTTTLPAHAIIDFEFTFNSKTVVDSIYIKKEVPNCPATEFETIIRVPDYPNSLESGTINVRFANGFSDTYSDLRSPACGEDDQATFKFALRDVDGHYSDTVTAPIITIKQ